MLRFDSFHIRWISISNLELLRFYEALRSDPVLLNALTVNNICLREYALTLDAIMKQLLPGNRVGLA